MAIPRDLVKLTIALTVAVAVAAGITTIVTWFRSHRIEESNGHHPWDHTVGPSNVAE